MNTYFDNAATTKVDSSVIDEMIPFYNKLYGNPSANNTCGRIIRESVDNARFEVCKALNCTPNEIIFTSGATESNNLVIKGCSDLCCNENYHYIFSSIEHKSILNLKDYLESKGNTVDLIDCLPNGIIDLDHLESLITEDTILVSCIYVNNETGMIQPIKEVSEICKYYGIMFHTDATQAFGKLSIDVNELEIDFLSLSAHKFHGPKGVGALYKNNNVNLACQIIGGSQEDGYRSGTENVPGIIGLGKATQVSQNSLMENYSYFEKLEKYFLKKLGCYNFNYVLNGDVCCKVPWIFNIAFLDAVSSNDLVEKMQDFCFSKSSACSKGNYPSHVLTAMHVDEDLINRSIRISFSKYTTFEEIDLFFDKLSTII